MHPLLRISVSPLCLHAYALSSSGVNKLFPLLSDPWVAYQTPIDTAMPNLIRTKRVTSFSLQPPLVIQGKELKSDLRDDDDDTWRGVLMDSTEERVWREERGEGLMDWWEEGLGGGKDVDEIRAGSGKKEERRRPNLKDPAVKFRPKIICRP